MSIEILFLIIAARNDSSSGTPTNLYLFSHMTLSSFGLRMAEAQE